MQLSCFLSLAILVFSGSVSAGEGLCPRPWICEGMRLEVPYTSLSSRTAVRNAETIRAGYFPESGSFRGNILYFEGLGDSMLNHQPLFKSLSEAGFRVLAFDYMGQGGSSGKMDRTRIETIPWIGNAVWKRFAKVTRRRTERTAIGWSTGGLAAYLAAARGEFDRVVLIAPGIAPNQLVGGGLSGWPLNEITLESLTTAAPYPKNTADPHIEAIRPNSPMKVMSFAIDLLLAAKKARRTPMPSSVNGLVLLSGEDDTYVDAAKTREALKRTAPGFKVVQYPGALHEIDNEREEIRRNATQDILDFLKAGS